MSCLQVVSVAEQGPAGPPGPAGPAGSGLAWNEITASTQAMAPNNGYVANNPSRVALTLPPTAAFGDVVRVSGKGAGGWLITQNAGQTIHFGSTATTTGAGGSVASNLIFDAVELLCITANSDFSVLSAQGNLTVT